MTKLFKIIPQGRMGNLMFQYMFAVAVKQRVPDLRITGLRIKEWGLFDQPDTSPAEDIDPNRVLRLNGHRFNLPKIIRALNRGSIQCIEFAGWGCRAEYYPDRKLFGALFIPPHDYSETGFGEEYLVVHVRAEDIVGGKHPDYMPVPVTFIRAIIEETRLVPVFTGQLGDDWYSQQLRAEFAGAIFREGDNVIADFELIRHSKNVLISVSTFSWLAAWLSETNSNIYMPLLGFLNPAQRPQVHLTPRNDPRFHCYQFPVIRYTGDPAQIEAPGFRKANSWSAKAQEIKGVLLRR